MQEEEEESEEGSREAGAEMRYWPRGQSWWPHPRLEIQAPQWDRDSWWRTWGWHGGDEYGNCSVYIITGLLGGFVFFYELDFQRDVLQPDPGMSRWADRRLYAAGTCPSEACMHFDTTQASCDGYAASYPDEKTNKENQE